jgi:ParB/RepB/Spo0J family partition protein
VTPLFDLPKLLDIQLVLRSHLNPRRRFKEQAMKELADNIKRHGVLQPILTRPTMVGEVEHFEIVAGERRWRASCMAELPQVPSIVREMTDTEALEIAVIENAQREDLHPLEEAEGFEALLRAYGHADATDQSADDLAAKIGKSRTHVYNRLKLLALVPDLREAFYAEEFNATIAQKLARLPAKLQPKALAKLRKATAEGDEINVKAAGELLRREFHLRIDKATFPITDATLLEGAGSCLTCSRMSGNEPSLFDDEPDNVCTDGDCFTSKLLAFNERIKSKAREAGLVVFEGDGARVMLRFGTASDELNGDYVYMDRGMQALTGTDKSLQRLLGKLLKPSALFEHPKEQTLREVVEITKAIKALRDNDLLVHDPDKDKPKAKKPKADLGTSVATKPDTSYIEPSTPAARSPETEADVAWPFPTGNKQFMHGPTNDGDGDEQHDDAVHQLRVQHARAWRIKAVKALHADYMDQGYIDDDTHALRMVAIDLGTTYLDDAELVTLMAELWGWEINSLMSLRDNLFDATMEMNTDQLHMMCAELISLGDIQDLPDDDSYDVSQQVLPGLCEAQSVAWRELYDGNKDMASVDLSESDLPHQTPSPAGEVIGAASQGGDKSPQEDESQAPQGAQSKDVSQLAHWVGQRVKVKKAKRIATVVEVNGDGSLVVEVESWRTGKPNRSTVLKQDVEVLPGQTSEEVIA